MNYKIKGIEIRSENSAKPITNSSAYLISWLSSRKITPSALDFGCGKLRYTNYLAEKSNQLGIVDSNIQLSRIQTIDGKFISVKEYARKRWPACRIHKLTHFWKDPSPNYHFILCANVLSAIPSLIARTKSLHSMHTALYKNGQLLFVNQHTNSYFTQIQKKANIITHLNGFITQSKTLGTYYGILNKDAVIKLAVKHGFIIKDAWIEGQSNYVLVSKR